MPEPAVCFTAAVGGDGALASLVEGFLETLLRAFLETLLGAFFAAVVLLFLVTFLAAFLAGGMSNYMPQASAAVTRFETLRVNAAFLRARTAAIDVRPRLRPRT